MGGTQLEQLVYWVWLSLLNLSPRAVSAALREFGNAEQVFLAPKTHFVA